MKKFLLGAAAVLAFPAQAALVAPGANNVPFDPFAGVLATQGTRLDFRSDIVTALTFKAEVRSAVYRNTFGTLDFYYQVQRLGAGNNTSGGNNEEIHTLTGAQYHDYSTFAYVAGNFDVDGAGDFQAAANPSPLGFTSTAGRTLNGNRVEVDFGDNGLVGTERSAVYIFRTNAAKYGAGTFGLINGSAIGGPSFAPVPEPATWAMMIGGFGLLGAASRRSTRAKSVLA